MCYFQNMNEVLDVKDLMHDANLQGTASEIIKSWSALSVVDLEYGVWRRGDAWFKFFASSKVRMWRP